MAKGSLFKEVGKDGTVSWRVRVDMVDPVTGKRRQPQRTYRTKREAEAGMAQWLVEIERGTAVDRSKQTVAEMLTDWLETYARHNVRLTTLDDYEVTIRVHLIPALGSIQVQKLTPAHLQRFYAQKLTVGCSPRVVQLCHRRLAQALAQGVRLGLVPRNVTDVVVPPRVVRKEMKTWSADEARRFLAAARGSTYGPLWAVLLGTGLRRGEVLGLRWRDIDFEQGTLRVAQSVLPLHGVGHIQQPKTASSRRPVLLAPTLLTVLREHRAWQNERRLALGADWQDHDLVFAATSGQPINPDNLRREYARFVRLATVPRIRIHDLRHTYATLNLAAGVPLKAVSEALGHATASITVDIYAHTTAEIQQRAAHVIDTVLFSETSEDSRQAAVDACAPLVRLSPVHLQQTDEHPA